MLILLLDLLISLLILIGVIVYVLLNLFSNILRFVNLVKLRRVFLVLKLLIIQNLLIV